MALRLRTGDLLIDPVPFAISVLMVLYTATIIGITVEIVFSEIVVSLSEEHFKIKWLVFSIRWYICSIET